MAQILPRLQPGEVEFLAGAESGCGTGVTVLLPVNVDVGGSGFHAIQPLANRPQFLKDRTQQFLGGGGGGVEHFNSDLLDSQHVPGEASHFIGVKQQGLFLVAAIFRVEFADVEGGIEIAGICIGIAINRSPGTVEGFLDVVDANQGLNDVRAVAVEQARQQLGCT